MNMYRVKNKKFFGRKRTVILTVSLILLLIAAAGGTMAYLAVSSRQITNIFQTSEAGIAVHETKTENTKSDIYFTNSETDQAMPVYIRAALAVYWTDTRNGETVTIAQPAGGSVEFGELLNNGWFQVGEIYYYESEVAVGAKTTVMLDTIRVTLPDDSEAECHIDIHAEAIQASPASAVEDAWIDVAVDADGKLVRKG